MESKNNEWLDVKPEPIMVAGIDLNILDQYVRGVILHYSEVFQCPKEFCLFGAMAAITVAVGKKVCVYNGKYTNYAQFYFAFVAPSGSNKTQPLKEFLKPLSNMDAEAYKVYRKELKEHNKEDEKPIWCKRLVQDCTQEALYKSLYENPGGLLMCRDELASYFQDVGRYTKGSSEVSKLLSMWSNDNVQIDRKGSEPLLIQEPYLSIIGGIQPSMLGSTFGAYNNGSGFIQRWCFVYPDIEDMQTYSDKRIDTGTKNIWTSIIRGYASLNDTVTIGIKEDAQLYYKTMYYNDVSYEMANKEDYYREYLAKGRIMVLRLALAIRLMRAETRGLQKSDELVRNFKEPIDLAEMMAAVEMMRYFEGTFAKAYEYIKQDVYVPKMTQGELIREINTRIGIVNQAAFAEALDKTPAYINKVLHQG